MINKHLPGRHNQKLHGRSTKELIGQLHDKWKELNLKGSPLDFLGKLKQYGPVDYLSYATTKGPDTTLANLRVSLKQGNFLSLALYETDDGPHIEIALGKLGVGSHDIDAVEFKTLDDDQVTEIINIIQGVEELGKAAGIKSTSSLSGLFPIRLAAELGYTALDLNNWVVDLSDTDHDWSDADLDILTTLKMMNPGATYIDFYAVKAQNYLNERYNMRIKQDYRPVWNDGQPVQGLLDIRHPKYSNISLFEEYLTESTADDYNQVFIHKQL